MIQFDLRIKTKETSEQSKLTKTLFEISELTLC